MKINTDVSSESENETDEDEDEVEGGLSDESANECLKRLEAQNKASLNSSSQDNQQAQSQGPKSKGQTGRKSDQPSAPLIDLEEHIAEECEPEETRRKKKKKHR